MRNKDKEQLRRISRGYFRLLRHLRFLERQGLDKGAFKYKRFPPKKRVAIRAAREIYPEMQLMTTEQICLYVERMRRQFPYYEGQGYTRREIEVEGSYVYIIGSLEYGLCKIGVSTNLKSRLSALQTSCPFDLEILAVFPGKGRGYEAALQMRAAPYMVRGEWFRIEGRLKEYLDSVADGEDDLEVIEDKGLDQEVEVVPAPVRHKTRKVKKEKRFDGTKSEQSSIEEMVAYAAPHYEKFTENERSMLDSAYRATQLKQHLTDNQLSFLRSIYEKARKIQSAMYP